MQDLAAVCMSDIAGQEHLNSIKPLDTNRAPEFKLILARQHIITWNEEHNLDIALGRATYSREHNDQHINRRTIVLNDILWSLSGDNGRVHAKTLH